MWELSASDRLAIVFRWALLPLCLVAILVIHLAVRPPLWVMVSLCLVLPAYLVLERLATVRAVARLDREFTALLPRGDARALSSLIERSRWLRWVRPGGVLEEKQGLVASLEKNWPEAELWIARAYARSPIERRPSLLPPLLRAKFEMRRYDEAETIAQRMLGRGPLPTHAELYLGLILVTRPERREEAVRLLKKAHETLGPEERERAYQALVELEAVPEGER